MALRHFTCNALTGGVSGCLDYLWPGDDLVASVTILDGYLCTTVVDGDKTYFHRYNASSTASTSSPEVIKAVSNTGNGAWEKIPDIPETLYFSSEAARDAFFASNPTKLKDGMLITIGDSVGGATVSGQTYQIQNHSSNAVLTSQDMNTIHICSAAVQLTLPEITSDMIGMWIRLKKDTTATVSFIVSGSDTIEGDTTIANSTTDTADFIELVIEALTDYGVHDARGTWIGA